MTIKIRIPFIILGFLLLTTVDGAAQENIFERYCSKGKEGYYNFRRNVHLNQRNAFWDDFVNLVRRFHYDRAFDKLENCREFWKNYRQDEYIDIHKHEIEEELEEMETIFLNLPHSSTWESFDCPPYLKALEFTLSFPSTYTNLTQVVEIIQPDNQALNTSNVTTQNGNADISVPYPQPGTWRIFLRDSAGHVDIKPITREVRLMEPGAQVRLTALHTIKFQVYDPLKKNAFKPLKKFPMDATITIEGPGIGPELIPVILSPNKPGVFIADAPFRFRFRGEYYIRFKAMVVNNTGSPQLVLKSGKVPVLVNNSTPIKPVLKRPKDTIHSFFTVIGQRVVIIFYNESQKLEPDDIFKSPIVKVQATAEILDGATGNTIKTLDIDLEIKNRHLTGTLGGKLPITDLHKILLGKRTVKLVIDLKNDYLKKDYSFSFAGRSVGCEFLLDMRVSFFTHVIIAIPLVVLLWFFLRRLKRRLKMWLIAVSCKHIPVLVYRNYSYIPDKHNIEKIVLNKKETLIQQGKVDFVVPGSSTKWAPKMKIIKELTPWGVALTIYYEKFNQGPTAAVNRLEFLKRLLRREFGFENKMRFRKTYIRTPDPHRTGKHLINELKEQEMIFELLIKDKKNISAHIMPGR